VTANSNEAICASVRIALYVVIDVGHASSWLVRIVGERGSRDETSVALTNFPFERLRHRSASLSATNQSRTESEQLSYPSGPHKRAPDGWWIKLSTGASRVRSDTLSRIVGAEPFTVRRAASHVSGCQVQLGTPRSSLRAVSRVSTG
jgi:hypothetical protein